MNKNELDKLATPVHPRSALIALPISEKCERFMKNCMFLCCELKGTFVFMDNLISCYELRYDIDSSSSSIGDTKYMISEEDCDGIIGETYETAENSHVFDDQWEALELACNIFELENRCEGEEK